MTGSPRPRIVLGVSGASGAPLAMRCAELFRAAGADLHLVVSSAARRTLLEEIDATAFERLCALADRCHAIGDIGAAIASGSFPSDGMIVAPCSMRSLAAIAQSLSDNLLIRCADVHLKERRPLVLLAREAPLHLGHLRAMAAVTEMGAIVLPPVPAFYLRPQGLDEVVDQIARRAIDLLRVFPPLARPWDPGRR